MSPENVELARRYVETFNAQGLDGAEELWHSEVELHDPPEFPDADRHIGKPAFRKRVEEYIEVVGWDRQYRVDEYIDAGDEVIIVWRARGESDRLSPEFEGSIPFIEVTIVQVFRFEDGQVRRVRQFMSRDQALEAAGSSE